MKVKLFIIPAVVVATAFGVAMLAKTAVFAHDDHPADIAGVWEVTADAPYAPHLFTFHNDGTMTSTNPTNVQEVTSHTNDSLGMGVWQTETHGSMRDIIGTFEELNANSDTHVPTGTLSVSFKVQLTDNGSQFAGPANVKLGNGALQMSKLHGTRRVTIDQTAVNQLHL